MYPAILEAIQPYYTIQHEAALAFIALLEKSKEAASTINEVPLATEDAPTLPEENQWLDNQEVCQLLKLSDRTLRRYRQSGKLPSTTIGGKIYFLRSEVNKILKDKFTQ